MVNHETEQPFVRQALGPGEKHEVWDHLVLSQSANMTRELARKRPDRTALLPQTLFQRRSQRPAERILEEAYAVEKRYLDNSDWEGYLRRKQGIYMALTKEIKREKFRPIKELHETLSNLLDRKAALEDITTVFIQNSYLTLYLLCSEPTRTIAGIKDGIVWKNVSYPLLSSDTSKAPIFEIAAIYQPFMPYIGQREAVMFPSEPVHPLLVESLKIPQTQMSSDDSLEEAFYRQRYIVPPEGAEVHFQNAGDLEKVVLIQSGKRLLSRVVTVKGDIAVSIDLDDGLWFSSFLKAGERGEYKYRDIVADVYRDLVTAEEIHAGSSRRLSVRRPKTLSEKPVDEAHPRMIWIPRRVRINENNEPRMPYDGPKRSMRPHRVEGFPRKGNMTPKHREVLEQYERELGIDILGVVPPGKTWVRAFERPRVDNPVVGELPQFIKRMIQEKFAERFATE